MPEWNMRMVGGCGVFCASAFGSRSSGGQTFPSLLNCRSLLFARSVVGGSGLVQGMMRRGVSLNLRRWVVGTQVIN